MVYKLADTIDRRSEEISDMPFINHLEDLIITVVKEIILRRQKCFDGLLNTEIQDRLYIIVC